MKYYKVFWSDGRFLRWTSNRMQAIIWAIAIDGYFQEVDTGGKDWANDD